MQQAANAQIAYISAQEEYASLLAVLRHEAGLMVQDGAVDPPQLVVPPSTLLRK